jgi:acyl carrier protein phosphodiesterase
MANPIKYTDAFDPDFLKGIDEAEKATTELKNSLLEIANLSANKAKSTPLGSYEDIKKITEALKKFNDSQKGIEEADKRLIELDKLKEKLSQEKINTSQKEEKLAQSKIKTENDLIKQKEASAKSAERERKEREKNNSLYAKESKRLNDLRKSYKELVLAGKQNEKGTKDLRKEIQALDKTLKDVDADVGQFQRNVGNYGDALGRLPGIFGVIANSGRELKTVFTTISKSPLLIAIVAIGSALIGLVKSFKSTDSGGTEVAVRMEQISAIVDVLRERAVLLTDGLKSIFSGNILEGLKQISNVFSGISQQVNKAVEGSREYIEALDKLEDSENNYISNAADNANKIARLRFEAANTTLDVNARREALVESLKIDKEETEKKIDFAKDRLKIEAKYLADKNGLTKKQVLNFIKLSDEEQANASSSLKTLRNNYEDKLKELEELYKKTVDADTEYYEQNKRNNAKLAAFDEEILKQKREFYSKLNEITNANEQNENKASLDRAKENLDRQSFENQKYYDRIINQEKVFNKTKINRLKELYNEERELLENQLIAEEIILTNRYEFELEKINESIENEEIKNAKKKSLYLKYALDIGEINSKLSDSQFELDKKEKASLLAIEQKKKEIILDTASEVTNQLSNELDKRNALIEKQIDDEITMREKSIERQQELAEKGLDNTLAFEEQKRVEAELRKRQQEERAQKQQEMLQLTEAYFNFLNSRAKTDANSAPALALKDTLLSKTIAKGISGFFFEGTERVEQDLRGNKVHNGRDGYVIGVDGTERIFNGVHNATLGNISNDEVVSIVSAFKHGLLPTYTTSQDVNYSTTKQAENEQLKVVYNAFVELKETIKNKPETSLNLDNLGNVIETRVENNVKTIIKKFAKENRLKW